MGTNYYLKFDAVEKDCETCGQKYQKVEEFHIGKSSAGWCFGLHVMPEEGLSCLDDWLPLFQMHSIRDEYSRIIEPQAMADIITDRNGSGFDRLPMHYTSWEMFHVSNCSQEGPEGLLRHRLNNHCVGHGDGTWDYISGEFS